MVFRRQLPSKAQNILIEGFLWVKNYSVLWTVHCVCCSPEAGAQLLSSSLTFAIPGAALLDCLRIVTHLISLSLISSHCHSSHLIVTHHRLLIISYIVADHQLSHRYSSHRH
jgi:hypothetical protein